MIERKTLIVLGAGASAAVKMPTGDKLKTSIRELLDFDKATGSQTILNLLKNSCRPDSEFPKFSAIKGLYDKDKFRRYRCFWILSTTDLYLNSNR